MIHDSNQEEVWKDKKAELTKSNIFVVDGKYVLLH